MRRFLPWMLVGVLLLQVAGLNVLYSLQLSAHKQSQWRHLKQELAANPSSSMISVLQIADLGALKWEGSKEFEWGGEMYDFIALRRLPTGWEVRALRDDRETMLKQRIATQLGAEPQDPGRVPVRIWTRLLVANYLAVNAISISAPVQTPACSELLAVPHGRSLSGPPAPPPDFA